MNRRAATGARIPILLALGLLLLAAPGTDGPAVRGQEQVDAEGRLIPADEGTDPSLKPRVDVDKDLSKALGKARDYRQRGDFDSAVQIVQRYILDRKEDGKGRPSADRSADYFTDQALQTSLRREALELIAGLPEEGRRQYELKFGAGARALLDEAIAAGDVRQLETITRQYFHTQAGYEATYRLGTYKLDHGEPLAAARHLSQLRELPGVAAAWEPMLTLKTAIAWHRAGEQQRAVETIVDLQQAVPDGRLSLGDKTVTLFGSQDEAAGWLAQLAGPPAAGDAAGQNQWPLFRGDPSRNGNGSPASPAWDSVWEFTTIRDPDALPLEDPQRLLAIEEQLAGMEAEKRDDGFLTLPAAHPLIVGDAVIFRTLRNVRAVHLGTGELLWESTIISPPYERLVARRTPEANIRVNQSTTTLETLLAQRAWRDLAAGTLSSDGQHVYALEAMGYLAPRQRNNRGAQLLFNHTDYNKLVAYELATDGKPAWEVGGPRQFGLELAGTFFLGPPLPLDGHLYCIAEVSGEVRLIVLEARTGRLEWSQSLVLPDSALLQYPLRRLAGLSPAYSNGVLVCPTAAGAVVAIDPARRILLWGHRYERSVAGVPSDPRMARLMRARGQLRRSSNDEEDRWADALPTIADGRVLITPRDSGEVACLSLVDGKLLWKRPRGQSLYLATVYKGRVILVGRSQIEALSLETGEPAWDEPLPMDMPSGRGVRDGRYYRIPLATGEIATIDLDAGQVIARSKSRSGEVFGNLAVARGTIVSQSIDKLIGFKSLKTLREQTDGVLAGNPRDAAALALRGEMRLHAGGEAEGLADLRKSIDIGPTHRARTLVVATLLEGLRHNFQKYRETAAEIEQLVDDPRQRGRYLRLYAAGLHEMGNQRAAFDEYLKLAAADTGQPELERVNATLSVRSDRWIRPRIADVYRESSGAERDELDAAIDELLKEAADGDADVLRRFMNAFVDLPQGERAGQMLVARLDSSKQPLAQELLLRRLQRAESREIAGFATARLASLYIDHQRSVAAAAMLDELATQWNDAVCLNGKTGRQLVEEWRADEDIAKLLDRGSIWPDLKIEAKKVSRRKAVQRTYRVRILGPRGALGDDWTLALDSRRQNLVACNENGKELWKLPTGGLEATIPNVYGNYARVNGHLLIVVFGTHFAVLDGFERENGSPRILWHERLVDGARGETRNLQAQFRQVVGPGGIRVMTVQDRFGRPLGKVMPIDDSMICYQVGTRLVAADALTGETLWERRSVTRGSEIFGDREFVFVVAPNRNEAIVLRAADGKQVDTRPLPEKGTRLSTRGRTMLVWTGRVLQKYDVWTGKNVWERRVPPGAVAMALEEDGDAVAVLNPHQGSFALFDADDGELLIDSPIEPDANLDSFVVHKSSNRYILLTHSPRKQANAPQVVALNYNNPLVNGFVYGFDGRTGKKIWTTRIENQSFDVDQPAGLPVLIFTARTYRPFQGGRRFNRNQFSVAVLDKRNGRNIYSASGVQSLSQFEVTADLEEKQMTVNFYQAALHLTLTEEPLAEPVHATENRQKAEAETQ